jgi:hypothetical protein
VVVAWAFMQKSNVPTSDSDSINSLSFCSQLLMREHRNQSEQRSRAIVRARAIVICPHLSETFHSDQYDEARRPHFAMVGRLAGLMRTQRLSLSLVHNAMGKRGAGTCSQQYRGLVAGRNPRFP